MLLHALITLFFLGLFGVLILRSKFFRDPHLPREAFLGAFLLKFLAGLTLWAIYSFYYPMKGHSDAFNYFDEAMVLHGASSEEPLAYLDILLGTEFKENASDRYIERVNHWHKPYNYGIVNDNRTIIRANMLCRWVSFGYYHVHTAIFSFISFLGLFALYKSFVRFLPAFRYACFGAAFLIPSVVFWSSGVLKEGVLIFALGFFIHYLVHCFEAFRWRYLLGSIVFFLLLISVKTYVLLALLPGLLCYMATLFLGKRWTLSTFLGGHALLIYIAFSLPRWGVPYDIPGMIRLKQKDFYNVAEMRDAGSTVQAPELDGWTSFFLAAPEALWNAIFRPHLFEMEKMLYVPPAIENTLFLIALLLGVLLWKPPQLSARPFYAWSISFVLILGTLIGLTTPVLGAAIRYQIPFLPFFIFVILASIDQEKWERWRKKLLSGARTISR